MIVSKNLHCESGDAGLARDLSGRSFRIVGAGAKSGKWARRSKEWVSVWMRGPRGGFLRGKPV